MPDVPLPNFSPPTDAQRGAWTVALGDALPTLPDSDGAQPDGADAGPDSGAVTLSVSVAGTLDPLAPGTLLSDYKILGVLGRGGFGITYRARDGRSGREVAVKEFFPVGCVRRFDASSTWSIEPTPSLGVGAFEIARAQFVEGARVLSRFRHPSLARVWEFFERCNTAYLVMELLEGRTLQACVQEAGPLDEEGAIHIAHALGEAVSTMHRLDILHLDIKPENVMLCPSSLGDDADASGADVSSASTWGDLKSARVVLFDFDLLQRIEPVGLGTRPLTSHCGTPGYAPLEQYAQHAALGRFSDVYALGATLFSLLCSQDPPAAADRALSEDPLDPRAWRPDLSLEAASALAWAMEMAPWARPASVEEWLSSLREGRPRAPQATAQTAPQAAADTDEAHDSAFQVALAASNAAGSTVSGSGSGLLGSSISGARVLPASLPQPAALPALPKEDNWFQLISRELELDWPYSCACCGRRPDVSLQVKAGRARWGVPYCARCARHVKAAHQASAGTAWGIVAGLAVAFIGWLMSDFWIGPIGVAIHFSALTYGALKIQAAEALMRPRCCDRKHAVGFGGERETRAGKRYLVRFRSLKYAHEWKARNASRL